MILGGELSSTKQEDPKINIGKIGGEIRVKNPQVQQKISVIFKFRIQKFLKSKSKIVSINISLTLYLLSAIFRTLIRPPLGLSVFSSGLESEVLLSASLMIVASSTEQQRSGKQSRFFLINPYKPERQKTNQNSRKMHQQFQTFSKQISVNHLVKHTGHR